MGFFHPGVVEISNFDSFKPPKSCGGGGGRVHASDAYALRKAGRTLIWVSYRSQHGRQILSHL